MKKIYVRINGRGNAWPVFVGEKHPFYDAQDAYDLANASFSLIIHNADDEKNPKIHKEIAIDAGHGTVQNIIKYSNRIPDALVITHPHFDHTLGIDWIVQSHYRINHEKYPLYASELCCEGIKQSYPHLEGLIEYHKLPFDQEIEIREAPGIKVTAFPVYHGLSAKGASMMLFEFESNKVAFTGDVLTPLVTKQAYQKLKGIDLLISDANNRFPYPKCNHWSITTHDEIHTYIDSFIDTLTRSQLLSPHLDTQLHSASIKYLDEFVNNGFSVDDQCFTIVDFIRKISPKQLALIHYSGLDDQKYYSDKTLSRNDLEKWITKRVAQQISSSDILIPLTGETLLIK